MSYLSVYDTLLASLSVEINGTTYYPLPDPPDNPTETDFPGFWLDIPDEGIREALDLKRINPSMTRMDLTVILAIHLRNLPEDEASLTRYLLKKTDEIVAMVEAHAVAGTWAADGATGFNAFIDSVKWGEKGPIRAAKFNFRIEAHDK